MPPYNIGVIINNLNTYKVKWFFCFFSIVIVSCQGNDQSADNSPEYMQLRLKPDVGKTYSYQLLNESEMEQEVNEETFDNNSKLEMDVDYTFSKDTASSLRLTMQYKKFTLSMKVMEQEKELDASTAANSLEPSDKMFAAFHNAVVTATVDSFGNASSFAGVEAIKNKMNDYAGADQDARQMLDGSIKQYVSDAFFKESIESSFKAFTERKLRVGDTIMVATPVGGEFNITVAAVYKLESIRNSIASISTTATIDIKDQPITIEKTRLTANITGKQTGLVKINIHSGLLEESKNELNLKGVMLVVGREIPFKMKTWSKVTLK